MQRSESSCFLGMGWLVGWDFEEEKNLELQMDKALKSRLVAGFSGAGLVYFW